MSQVRRLDQIPAAQAVDRADQIAIWQNGRTRIGTISDITDGAVAEIFAGLIGSLATSALLSVFDSLPALPEDPASYPVAGGLFRNGDANGYSLVRIYPKA